MSPMGFLVRLLSLGLGIEGIRERKARVQEKSEAEEGEGVTEVMPGPRLWSPFLGLWYPSLGVCC